MSAADQVGAVIAFLVPFVGAYLLYRLVFALHDARQRRSLQRARDQWVADPLSWIMVEDATAARRLETLEQWREEHR
jgi:hypothetical protein